MATNKKRRQAFVEVFLGLGSNLNNPVQQLDSAIHSLQQLPECEWQTVSSFHTSPPMGPQDQPDYVNAVACLRTTLDAFQLLAMTMAIEQKQKRSRGGQRWGPRTLDIDLLLYGSEIINSEQLTVPHPGMHERLFVLQPLSELVSADFDIPGQGRLGALLSRLKS